MSYDFANYKQDAKVLPRNKAWSNWAKFEKVGDRVQGFIRDVFYRAAEGQFKEARGLTIEQPNGELINVAVKRLPFVLKSTDEARLGDPITIELESILPPRQKGYKGAKQFGYYTKNIPETEGQKTVKELEEIDMKEQGAKAAAAVDELDEMADQASQAMN